MLRIQKNLVSHSACLKLISSAHLILWVCQTDAMESANERCSIVLHKFIQRREPAHVQEIFACISLKHPEVFHGIPQPVHVRMG